MFRLAYGLIPLDCRLMPGGVLTVSNVLCKHNIVTRSGYFAGDQRKLFLSRLTMYCKSIDNRGSVVVIDIESQASWNIQTRSVS